MIPYSTHNALERGSMGSGKWNVGDEFFKNSSYFFFKKINLQSTIEGDMF